MWIRLFEVGATLGLMIRWMNFSQRLWDVFICWSRESGSKLLWINGASHLHCCLSFMTKISARSNAPSIVRLNDVHVSLRAWNWRQAVDPMLGYEYGWSLPYPFMVHFSFSADLCYVQFYKTQIKWKNSRFFETFKDPILTFGSWATFGELSTAIDYHIIITVVCVFVKLLEASVPVLVLSWTSMSAVHILILGCNFWLEKLSIMLMDFFVYHWFKKSHRYGVFLPSYSLAMVYGVQYNVLYDFILMQLHSLFYFEILTLTWID